MFEKYTNIKNIQSIEKCIDYSDNPEELKKLIDKLSIQAIYKTIKTTKLANFTYENLVLIISVKDKINNKKYKFDFSCCNIDTVSFMLDDTESFTDNLLYNILTNIKNNYYCPDNFDEFCEEFGFNNDSIADFQTFKKWLEDSKKLQKMFTQEEIEYLPD
jgi:hypothetical protein